MSTSILQDKVILVSGSTLGIGKATAEAIVAAGGKVMIHGRNEQRASELAAELGENAAYHLESCQSFVTLFLQSTVQEWFVTSL